MKRFIHRPVIALLASLSIGIAPTRADDTQLFMLPPSARFGLPNVLLVWDNTANWNQPFDTEKAALKDAFDGLSPDLYNVGMMMFSETGNPNSNTDGGYVRAAIRNLSSDYRSKLKNLIDSLDILADKSNGGKYGLTMWEIWQYFNGLAPNAGNQKQKADYLGNTSGTAADQAIYALTTNPNRNALSSFAATTYNKPPSDGCQKNYVIFLSNGPAADNNSDTSTATTALSSAGGSTQAITLSPSGSQTNVADEWARFMANHSLTNREKIFTYTIDVNPGGTGQGPGHSALLKSMASPANGKGKYYCYGATQNALGDVCATSLREVLDNIFKEILAVNAVFSSVTLPINVNVRGRLLNQVYMGIFRPDGDGKPLWPGNLKAYKVGQTGTNADQTPIYGLVDQSNNAIENNDTTSSSYGFIKSNVTSFWSHTTTTPFWDATYYPDAQGSGGTQDAPDGEMVEKGGAAQRLRDFYSQTSGAGYSINDATNGRKLYTCVSASGATCSNGSVLSTMPFSTGNANLTDSTLGLTSNATVTLTRSGSTVTATGANHPFSTGQTVTISGANETQYNGTFTVTKTGTNTFTYPIVEEPVTPATTTGTMQAAKNGSPISVTSITRTNYDATTATVNTSAAHGYTAGVTSVTISGSSGYNGTYTVQTTPTATSFTISGIVASPASPATEATTSGVQFYSNSTCSTASGSAYTIKTSPSVQVVRTLQTVTVDVTSNLPGTLPGYVRITGVTPSGYNVTCQAATKTGNKQFTYSLPTANMSPVLSDVSVGMQSDGGALVRTVTSIVRSGTTATATTSVAHGFSAGNSVVVSGATQTQYNVTATILSVPTTTSFTYTVSTAPNSPATGTITAQLGTGGVTASALINWVRGINTQDNDNPNPSTDQSVREADVRGYLHGDVLHSRPIVINYNRSGEPADRDIVVYYGANDGFLRAIKGGLTTAADASGDGKELWGFIAPEHFGQLERLYTGVPAVSFSVPKPYFFDGPISSNVVYNGSGRLEGDDASATIFAAMRRGGEALYAFNVKSPTAPQLLWRQKSSNAGFEELGQTWSEAKVVKIASCSGSPATCTPRTVVVFGAGYDATADDASPQGTATKGRGIYMLDATTGEIIWMAGPVQPANFPNTATFLQVTGMTYPIPSDLAVVDRNGDGYIDRIYAPDTGGNIWRVNIDPTGAASTWTVGKLASLRTASAGTGYNNYRKFLAPPDVVFGLAYDAVLIGSGDREHPFDTQTENRFYMIKDDPSLTASSGTSAGTAITESTVDNNMCDVTNNVLPTNKTCDPTVSDPNDPQFITNCSSLLAARSAANSCINAGANKGWFIKFCEGEKVVNTPITLAGAVNFGTNVPRGSSCNNISNTSQCVPDTGEARLYFIDYRDGTPLGDTNSSGTYTTSDRYNVAGGGFPPSGTQITTEIDGKPTDIVCSGSHCLTPPTPTYGRRYRIFWKVDSD